MAYVHVKNGKLDFDVVIAGCGLTGCVLAERLADQGKKVLIIEKRNHIAGNCYDYFDKNTAILDQAILNALNVFSEIQETSQKKLHKK